MSNLQIFNNNEFGEIRTTVINNEPYLMLNDVCKILEIKNPRDIKSRLNSKGVDTTDILTEGGNQQATFINESNFYKVVFQSRKPQAEKFTEYVTSEILPSIRKHGMYAKDELLDNPDLLLDVIQKYKAEREEKLQLQSVNKKQQQIIGELKPKADYLDRILRNKGLVTITQIAKDYGMSGTEMNKLLHTLKVQFKQSGQWLLYVDHQGKGYTHSETIDITRSDGTPDVKMNTKWTQKGRLFLYELLKENEVYPDIEKIA